MYYCFLSGTNNHINGLVCGVDLGVTNSNCGVQTHGWRKPAARGPPHTAHVRAAATQPDAAALLWGGREHLGGGALYCWL